MAWTFIANRGTATTKASGTTLGVAPTATIAAGRILVVRCASDDTTGSGPTHDVTDSAGNTYFPLVFVSASSSAASSACSIHISKLTTQLTTASTVTLTLGSTLNTKIIELTEFSAATGFTYALGGSNTATGSGTTPSVTIGGLSSIARLWLGLVTAEGLNGDTFTQDADYVQTITIGTTGNPTASNLKASGGHRIATQTGDTYNPTITSRDWTTVLAAVNETAIPAANFEASISGVATTSSALTTSITMASSVNGIATATGDELFSAAINLEASISAQANSVGRLTLPDEENYSAMSDYLEVNVIKHIFRTGSFTKPSALYISLHTEPLDDDATGAEVSGGSYARVQLDPSDSNWAAVGVSGTNALTSNAIAVIFPTPTADWGQVTAAGIWDASTAGNLLFHCSLASPVTISSGASAPRINAGDLQINISVPPITEFIALSANISASATAIGSIGTTLLTDDFEAGNCSAWTAAPFGCNAGDVFVNSNQVHAGTKSLELHYQALATQDDNLYLRQTISPAVNEIYVRGYLYIKTPEVGGDVDGVQRKFISFYNDPSGTLWGGYLTSDSAAGVINLRFSTDNSASCSVTAHSWFNIAALNYDTWYSIEIRRKNNTPSAAAPYDGEIQVWIDGVDQGTETDWNFNGTCSDGIGTVRVGVQAQGDQAVNEYRYWDDVVIATGYIGP